jgi:muramoyltetrapeptide carboxypeptidase LdcA involved in peptidoglycan recycling
VVSPSSAAPALFPEVHEVAIQRLRDELGLVAVEYPTTRQMSSPQARARDLMAAYADPTVRAVMATIGGDDQITLLPYLDPAVFLADPKPFFGYSDNTNLLNWLWNLGLVAYHGGSTMVHLSRPGGLHPLSIMSLRAALFHRGDVQLSPAESFSEDEGDWNDPASRDTPLPTQPGQGWIWHGPNKTVRGPSWGGNLEILHWNLAAGRWIQPNERYRGCVLLLETSEEMPSAEEVFRMLRNAGERGLLSQFVAVLVGVPKAVSIRHDRSPQERAEYRSGQREAMLRAFASYAPDAPVVFGLDIGHTDPQWVLPYGGDITVDSLTQTITAHY